MQYKKKETPKESRSTLLSNKEPEWLSENIKVSKSFEYQMKSNIRIKGQLLLK